MSHSMKTSRVWGVLIALVMLLTMIAANPAQAQSKFTDVNDRYKEAVNYLVENGITKGISETEYGTYEPIKRVDAAIMLVRALKLETTEGPSGFTDVPARGEAAVKALRDAKIVSGKTDTYFGAYDNIMRGEMALILSRGYKLSGEGVTISFTDVIGTQYEDAVKALYKHEITFGKTPNTFAVHDNVTRGEFALFLHRLAQLDKKEPAAIDLSVLEDALIGGSINIDKLLSESEILRLSLPLEALAGHEVSLELGGIKLLGLTLTQEDINRGYVDLALSTDIIKTLTGGVPLELVANLLESTGKILDSATETITLPGLLVKPVVDLAKNTVLDLQYILAGQKELLVDITPEGIEQVKAGDQLKLIINAGGKTETVSKVITEAEVKAGVAKYTFTDTDLIGRLLEGLTVGSEVVITPEITDGITTTKGEPVSYTVTEGLLKGVIELLVGVLGSVLSDNQLDGLVNEVLGGVLGGDLLGNVLNSVLGGGLLGEQLGGDLLGGLLDGLLGGDLLNGILDGLLGGVLDGLLGGDLLGGLLGGVLGGLLGGL